LKIKLKKVFILSKWLIRCADVTIVWHLVIHIYADAPREANYMSDIRNNRSYQKKSGALTARPYEKNLLILAKRFFAE
jgi:hypothetical protein